jgi:hypothetical protein
MEALTDQDEFVILYLTDKIREAFAAEDAVKLAKGLETILSWLTHKQHKSFETIYKTVLLINLRFLKFKVASEVSESNGDFDIRVTIPGGKVFVIEFKFEEIKADLINAGNYDKETPLAKALSRSKDQIEARGYARRYALEGVPYRKVAVGIAGRTDVRVEFY